MDNVTLSPNSLNRLYLNVKDKSLVQSNNVLQETNISNDSAVTVTISSSARDKLAEEKVSIGQKIVENFTAKKQVDTQKVEESSTESLDAMIEQIEEQITEINEKLNKLNNDKTEDAAKERDALTAQLMNLQGTLISLIGKKLDTVEAEASA
ncbi:hypothetical protein [Thalassotalea profundi]|uniref:Uncharacterized protein n=1 Tax=Thalassotalea profundi TaxID=2036687 RepID=A0ABQ3J067_9GAMM|nr:hypothetical protein [Thalassotalea profundi]GHE98261.1 hypothetical protein GCM10011501_29750 [Thalassotalea profundi]